MGTPRHGALAQRSSPRTSAASSVRICSMKPASAATMRRASANHLDDLTSRDRDRARGIGEHEIPRPDPDTVDHHRPVGLERRHHITTRAGRLPRHHVANPNRRNCAKSRNRPSGQAVVLHPRHLRTAPQRYIRMPVACQHQHPKLIDPTVPDAADKVLLDRLAWWACARRTARPALRRLTDLVDGLLGHHLTGSRLN